VTNIASSRGFSAKMTGSSFVQLTSGEIIGELLGIVDFPAAKEGIRIALEELEELEPPIEGTTLRGSMFQVRKRRNIRIIYSGPQHGKEELGVETGRVRRIIIREWD
jgi:hypothetical protein